MFPIPSDYPLHTGQWLYGFFIRGFFLLLISIVYLDLGMLLGQGPDDFVDFTEFP